MVVNERSDPSKLFLDRYTPKQPFAPRYLLVESIVLVEERIEPDNIARVKSNDDIQVVVAACQHIDVVRRWERFAECDM